MEEASLHQPSLGICQLAMQQFQLGLSLQDLGWQCSSEHLHLAALNLVALDLGSLDHGALHLGALDLAALGFELLTLEFFIWKLLAFQSRGWPGAVPISVL